MPAVDPAKIGPENYIELINLRYGPDGLEGVQGYTKINAVPVGAVATPVIDQASGAYTAAINVTITCATSSTTIYYTLDGTTPTDSSTEYSLPIRISSDLTLKAIAYKANGQYSSVATATYTFGSATLLTSAGGILILSDGSKMEVIG